MMKTNTGLRYVEYLRKSSDSEDKQIQSIPDQKRELQPLIQEKGLQIIKTLGESQSAKQPGRVKFNEMIELIEQGKADGIVCWKLNRLARNPIDGGRIQWLLQQGIIKSIITPGREYLPTDNVLMMAFELGMATQYVLDLGRDVKRGLRGKASKGWLPTGRKPGYIFDPMAEQGDKEVIPDPLRFSVIQRTFKTILEETYTPAQVLEKLNKEFGYRSLQFKKRGGKPMASSTFYRMLSDPFYYGRFEFPQGSGNWYNGTHTAMIKLEEFEKIQMILGRPLKSRPSKHVFPFTGLMKCGECSSGITVEDKWHAVCSGCKYKFSCKHTRACPLCGLAISEMMNPTIRHYIHYRCTRRKNSRCSQGGVETVKLEQQVDNLLSRIRISDHFKSWMIEKLNEVNSREVADRTTTLKSLQSAYGNCVRRIDNLTELKISPSNTHGELLSDEEFLERKRELLKEKDDLMVQLNTTDHRIEQWMSLAAKTFDFARHAQYWFEHGTDADKRVIMHGLGLNLRLFSKIFSVEAPSAFLEIEELCEKEPSVSEEFEPLKHHARSLTNADLEKLWEKSPLVRAFREQVWKIIETHWKEMFIPELKPIPQGIV